MGVPAAATHAGAGSGGGAERSRPGPPPRCRLGHPPGAVASRPGVYEPEPQAQQPPPAGGGRDPHVKRRPGRRGEQDRRRRPFLTFPRPLTPSGVFSRGQSPAPRLLGRTPGGVLRAPSPAPAPRAAGPGGPGGPAAASTQRKLYKDKIRNLPNVTVPGKVAQDGQKTQLGETQEEEKRR